MFEDESKPAANTIFALEMLINGPIMEIIPRLIFRWHMGGNHLVANSKAIKAFHASMNDKALKNKVRVAFREVKDVINEAVTRATPRPEW